MALVMLVVMFFNFILFIFVAMRIHMSQQTYKVLSQFEGYHLAARNQKMSIKVRNLQ